MKITSIELDGDKIVVELEEYPHAKPVFDDSISAKDLETALKAWKVNQDAVDEINRNAVNTPKPVVDISHLDGMIGKRIGKAIEVEGGGEHC